jgi:nitroimidazol reductase NimA-like FMN-containing flavoprotein (pyridoxamine 5'-phosphate oxidase superfamily)
VNNNVCFEFERNVEFSKDGDNPCKWSFTYESVIGFGKAHELRSLEEKKVGLDRIMRQYSGEEWSFDENAVEKTRVWKIEVESITGKRSK